MGELYQAEGCGYSANVRGTPTELGASSVVHNPRSAAGRTRNEQTHDHLLSPGGEGQIPFLVGLYPVVGIGYTAVRGTVIVATAVLVGVNLAVATYPFGEYGLSVGQASGSLGGIVLGLFGAGCAACGSALLAGLLSLAGASGLLLAPARRPRVRVARDRRATPLAVLAGRGHARWDNRRLSRRSWTGAVIVRRPMHRDVTPRARRELPP